jgi:UDP-2,3-diacylglucosamine pyrophosphatase LpxH
MTIPPSVVRQFDELYAVSDLHLGGPPGFQIFDTGLAFARVADHVRLRANSDRTVALLVNGDLVDFLAERPFAHFDPIGALDKLERIAVDAAFAPVWQALGRFANTDNCHLIINLGNHDLELALPWMRERLLDMLSQQSVKARGQVTLAFDGAGVRCRVGGAEVLAVHGNEVDIWNVADYETIRRIGRDLTQGVPVQPWVPNAGSRLVVEVMNDVKARFPFVDLLKPEIGAVIPTILAVAPDQRDKVEGISGTIGRLMVDRLRRAVGLLGEEEAASAAAQAAGQASYAPPVARPVLASGEAVPFIGVSDAVGLLDQAERRLVENAAPLSLIDADTRGDYLGGRSAFVRWVRGGEPSEVLREALERLGKDRSFDRTEEDAQFQALDKQVGDVDFLLAGHTHLERVIPRKRGRGTYFNSGTWVRLIQLDAATLANAAAFAGVFAAFKQGSMQALDAMPGLVARLPAVVAIWADQGRVSAELRHAGLTPADPVMTPVPGTRVG